MITGLLILSLSTEKCLTLFFFFKLYQLLKLEKFTQNVSMRDCKWPMCCRAGFLDMYQLPVSISTRASLWLC